MAKRLSFFGMGRTASTQLSFKLTDLGRVAFSITKVINPIEITPFAKILDRGEEDDPEDKIAHSQHGYPARNVSAASGFLSASAFLLYPRFPFDYGSSPR